MSQPSLKIHLIVNPYDSSVAARQAELQYCLQANRALLSAGRVHALSELWEGRLTFGEMFAHCKPDHFNVLYNADIFFDETLHNIARMQPHEAFALSRWDVVRFDEQGNPVSQLYSRKDSQDVWIVYGSARGSLLSIDFPMGIPGCDNRLCHVLRQAGYHVTNPSKRILSHHYHLSGHRTYIHDAAHSVPPPYDFVEPS